MKDQGYKAVLFSCCFLALFPVDGSAAVASLWTNKASVGYSGASGNTNATQLSGDFSVNRNNRWVDEYTVRGRVFYSTSNDAVDARKSTFFARYAVSFGAGPKTQWYTFFKAEADYDEFADIDSRYVAGPGVGYWLCDCDPLKALVEVAVAGERTSYVPAVEPRTTAIASPRMLFEQQVWPTVRFVEDLTVYAAIDRYRFSSETHIVNTISKWISAKVSVFDDYNSAPKTNAKKNDVRLVFGIQYTFP
jgi:putative salt-induced outer membrane protein YdiY